MGNKHLLAKRREFLLATQDGLQDRLFKFIMAAMPHLAQECRDAMEYAQKKASESVARKGDLIKFIPGLAGAPPQNLFTQLICH